MSQVQQQAALDYAKLEGLSYDEILAVYEARWQKKLGDAWSAGNTEGHREGRRAMLALARELGVSGSDLRELEKVADLDELQQAVATLLKR